MMGIRHSYVYVYVKGRYHKCHLHVYVYFKDRNHMSGAYGRACIRLSKIEIT